MPIYCDESGGANADAMTMAGVSLPSTAAEAVLARVRSVLGLQGELKGSRIALAERAFVAETLMAAGARVIAVVAKRRSLIDSSASHRPPEDLRLYASLLDQLVAAWLPQTGGCVDLVLDDGRYDPRINTWLRDEVQQSLGQWGRAALTDSHRSAGVQLADVMANSMFHIAVGGREAGRIAALLEPYLADHRIRRIDITRVGEGADQPS